MIGRAQTAEMALKAWHPEEAFETKLGKLGSGRVLSWKRYYLSCTNDGYKIKVLNWFQRVGRHVFKSYKDTHFNSIKELRGIVQPLKQDSFSDPVLKRVYYCHTKLSDIEFKSRSIYARKIHYYEDFDLSDQTIIRFNNYGYNHVPTQSLLYAIQRSGLQNSVFERIYVAQQQLRQRHWFGFDGWFSQVSSRYHDLWKIDDWQPADWKQKALAGKVLGIELCNDYDESRKDDWCYQSELHDMRNTGCDYKKWQSRSLIYSMGIDEIKMLEKGVLSDSLKGFLEKGKWKDKVLVHDPEAEVLSDHRTKVAYWKSGTIEPLPQTQEQSD